MPSRWMKLADFASRVAVPSSSARRWCSRGEIPAKRRGPKLWVVDLQSLKASGEDWHRELYRDAVGVGDVASALRNWRFEGAA